MLTTWTTINPKMKWVRIGRFCPVCLNIDYDSDWLEENKKEYEELRQYCINWRVISRKFTAFI
jgi:hypothetical protein